MDIVSIAAEMIMILAGAESMPTWSVFDGRAFLFELSLLRGQEPDAARPDSRFARPVPIEIFRPVSGRDRGADVERVRAEVDGRGQGRGRGTGNVGGRGGGRAEVDGRGRGHVGGRGGGRAEVDGRGQGRGRGTGHVGGRGGGRAEVDGRDSVEQPHPLVPPPPPRAPVFDMRSLLEGFI